MVTRIRRGARPHLYIREWREARALSLDALAGRLDVERNTIWRWENEQHRLNPDKIAALAAAFDIEPSELWGPPGRRSIDAMLADAPDDLRDTAADIVSRLTKRVS